MYGLSDCRSLLFMPADRERAVAKARGLSCDAVILDLEDAVPPDGKDAARDRALHELRTGFPGKIAMLRVNGRGTPAHDPDVTAARCSGAVHVVLPKVEQAADVAAVVRAMDRPVVAMIETPRGLMNAAAIAAEPGCAALFAGTNDLAAELGVRPGPARQGLELALQTIVLAAVLADRPAFDGVFNRLGDPDGLAAECAQGAAYGFRGKTLIHPAQVDVANRAFLGSMADLAADRRILEDNGAAIGAVRHDGAMVEAMHVAAARRRIDRARRLGAIDAG